MKFHLILLILILASFSLFKVKEKALKVLNKQKTQSNFGNAGAVEALISSAVQKAEPGSDGSIQLLPEHILDGGDLVTI
jgi:hypothetical protein